ncbi:MAG TPA: hypothetical protein VNL98_01805 [Gemmatimonadales bacterium]|nr:hypothetical protein [Gemmatimonadales bacterium]
MFRAILTAIGLTYFSAPAIAQCPDGTPPPCRRAASQPRPRVMDSLGVAVLYLSDLARDTGSVAIADGLTEELIATLSRVRGLHPSSRHAAARFRGARVPDPRRIGRELGVRYVVDGTVRRSGGRLRVVLTMTDVAAGFNVWGGTFDRPIEEIYSIQDSVAVQVAEAILGTRLSQSERANLGHAAPPSNVDAYQAYLRGRVAIRGRTARSASRAIRHYREALRLDPRFAPAWAALAHAYALARVWSWDLDDVPQDSIQPLALLAAERAVALDSSAAESWLAAAMAERARDVYRALELNRRAAMMDSANVEVIHQLAWGFLGTGELDSAISFERLAIARDPFYAYAYAGLAEMLIIAGRPEEALEVFAQGAVVDSTLAPLYWQRADAELRLGRHRQALEALERAERLGFDPLGARILRAIALVRSGDTAAARARLPEIERALLVDSARARGGLAFTSAGLLSGLFAQLGDLAGSLRWARSVEERPRRFYAVIFARHWLWEPVQREPLFQQFLSDLRR